MQRDATKHDVDGFPPEQEAALAVLVAGQGIEAAAKSAGVHRSTLHRWRTTDPAFEIEYRRRRREVREASEARLMQVADQALDVVAKAIGEGDGMLPERPFSNSG